MDLSSSKRAHVPGCVLGVLLIAVGGAGCATAMPQGARDIFSRKNTCPIPDQAQCIEAVKEYAAADFVGQVAGSAKLAAYVAKLRTPRQ